MRLFEMEGLFAGKCLPGDMKVNETNAEYLVRKFNELESKIAESQREFRSADITMQNLEAKCEKLAAENAGLKNSVENAAGCINAAYAEGLIDVLSESNDKRLVDLVKRRLLFSYLPVETPETNEELIAMGDWVLREQLEDGTRAIKTLNRRVAELEAKLETADKLQDSAFRNGLQHGFSYGQTNDQAGFEQCLAAYSSRGKANG